MNWNCPRCDEDNLFGPDYIVSPGATIQCDNCMQVYEITFIPFDYEESEGEK